MLPADLRIHDGLPSVTITRQYRGQQLELFTLLLDTGSAGTIFAADQVLSIG